MSIFGKIRLFFGERRTILLVDTEYNHRAPKERFFYGEYKFIIATSGESALEKIKKGEKVHLIITDWCLFCMTGSELAKKVRDILPHLPIIIVYTDSKAAESFEFDGASAGYTDGEPLESLRELVEELLDRC